MSNIPITPGSGVSSVATETVGGFDYQKIKLVDGTGGSTTALKVNADGSITASIYGSISVTPAQNQSVSGTVGASIIGLVPVAIISGGSNGGSVSGTVGASIIGTVPVVQSGTWVTSVVGGPVTLYAPSASLVSAVTSIITSTSQTSVLATAPGAQRNYVTQMLVTNAAAVGTFVDIMDGPNVVYSGYAAASGGGFSASFPAPFKQATTVQSLDMKVRVQASIIVAMSGYTAA